MRLFHMQIHSHAICTCSFALPFSPAFFGLSTVLKPLPNSPNIQRTSVISKIMKTNFSGIFVRYLLLSIQEIFCLCFFMLLPHAVGCPTKHFMLKSVPWWNVDPPHFFSCCGAGTWLPKNARNGSTKLWF